MAVCPQECITVNGRRISKDDIIDLPSQESKATPEQLQSLMLGRRSIRRFKKDEVPEDVLKKIVEIAGSAPIGIPPTGVEITIYRGEKEVQEFAGKVISRFGKISRMLKVMSFIFRPFFNKRYSRNIQVFCLPCS